MDLSYVNMTIRFKFRNGLTNVRKSSKGVSVPCRAPSLCPSRGRGVTITLGFFNSSNQAPVLACSSHW